MQYVFENVGDLAAEIESMAVEARALARKSDSKRHTEKLFSQAHAYEQAAHLVRNSVFRALDEAA